MNKPPLILIVDDDPLILRATARMLNQAGYRLLLACDALSGLQMARDQKPDLTLLDVNLPDMSGVEVCHLIKTDPTLAGCFVVLISGASIDSLSQVDGLGRGADGYIARPVTNAELLARVRGMLRIQQAEQALRASEEKYRIVADFTFDWEAWRAPDGAYLYVSPASKRISGHSADEFMADPNLMLQITHPDDLFVVSAHYDVHGLEAETGDQEFDFRIITTNNEIRWLGHSCTRVYSPAGQWLGRRESNRDITERKRAEAELREAHDLLEQRVQERTVELKAANLELEKAGRMKDEFLASMSHELRTPLTGILGLSEALQQPGFGRLSKQQKTSIAHIHSSGRRLLELINDILDLSKIEAGKLELIPKICDLEEICKASLRMVKTQAAAKGLQSNLSISPESILLTADARRLKQILNYLISNAIKFTPPDGSFGIEVLGSREARQVRITVWDTGIGIKMTDQGGLFQPFVQLDAGLERSYPGIGVGLVLVRRLTEMHGGSVSVRSEPGQGSRFTICLPWQPE